MNINNVQKKHLIQALHSAIQNEDSFIDAYSNVTDGSEKEPIRQSKKFIKRWKKLLEHFGEKEVAVEIKPVNVINLWQSFKNLESWD